MSGRRRRTRADDVRDPDEPAARRRRPNDITSRNIDTLEVELLRFKDPSPIIRAIAMNKIQTWFRRMRTKLLCQTKIRKDLMNVSMRGLTDTSPGIKIAAIKLMQQLVRFSGSALAPLQLKKVVRLCQDQRESVQIAATNAIGGLLLQCSTPRVAYINAFIRGPLLLLLDTNEKVQDTALSYVSKIFRRISKFQGGRGDPLPWLFLKKAILVNKESLINQAFSLQDFSDEAINKKMVQILKTHLGSVNEHHDLQVLILLKCLSYHVKSVDTDFILRYYYLKNTQGNRQKRQKRSKEKLLVQVLQIMINWVKCLPSHARSMRLRKHLMRRVASYNDECRVLAVRLAYNIDEDNRTWSAEMMKLSDYLGVIADDPIEAGRAAELSLVASEEPSIDLILFFRESLFTPRPEWTAKDIRACLLGASVLIEYHAHAATLLAPALMAVVARRQLPQEDRITAISSLTDIILRYGGFVHAVQTVVMNCLSSDTPVFLRRKATFCFFCFLRSRYIIHIPPIYYRIWALLLDKDEDVQQMAMDYINNNFEDAYIMSKFFNSLAFFSNSPDYGILNSRRQLYGIMFRRLKLLQQAETLFTIIEEIKNIADYFSEVGDIPIKTNEFVILDMIAALRDIIIEMANPPNKVMQCRNWAKYEEEKLQEMIHALGRVPSFKITNHEREKQEMKANVKFQKIAQQLSNEPLWPMVNSLLSHLMIFDVPSAKAVSRFYREIRAEDFILRLHKDFLEIPEHIS